MSARILVVEDEAIIARDIQATLQRLGYAVPEVLASGERALESIASQQPNLVLMDIHIKGKIDGIETAMRIRESYGTPVIFLTSYSDEPTIQRAKLAGAYGYVLKPFTDRDLRIAVEVALQKRALEVRMSERERWFATTLRSIGDAVIATDTDQRITFMNGIAERITGWGAKEAEGRHLADILRLIDETTGAPIESPLTLAFKEGFAVELPSGASLAAKGGAQRNIDDSAAPIIDEKGKVLGGVVVFRDITERRLLERRLAESERLAAIGTLSAGMSHEINNPLAYVLANVDYALESLHKLSARIRELEGGEVNEIVSRLRDLEDALREAKEGSVRVHRIVHDLKRFGRFDAKEHAVIELSDVIESAIRMTEHVVRHHARVRRDYQTTPYVEGDDGQLGQVFINLLLNAAQAIGEGGSASNWIVVATRTDDAGRAIAEVRDSGPGMSPELQRRVFDPFFTTKPVGQGSGLGLSICQSIVTAHGGEISVESKPRMGATFRLCLPAARHAAAPQPPPLSESPSVPPLRARVLIVDDEPAIGRALSRILDRDHEVFAFTDAREALERIVAGEWFDVIFCDLMMPYMTGGEFYEVIREAKPTLAQRIVFVTGGALTLASEQFLRATCNEVLIKPIDPTEIRRIVAKSTVDRDVSSPRVDLDTPRAPGVSAS